MTATGSGAPRTARPRSGCNAALAGCLALLLCAILIVGGASATWSHGIGRRHLAPWVSLAEGLGRIAHDSVVSHPRIAAVALTGPLPICPDVGTTSRRQLAAALALMRGTPEGNRLFGELVANGVCIRVAHLPYNSAYTRAVYSLIAGWSGTRIVVDDDVIASGESDVLAALLVHEATHVDRAIDGLSCAYTDACVRLAERRGTG